MAEALHLTLSAATAEQWAQRQPEKMEAYELYLLGRARQRKRTADDNVKAAEFFRRAVAADPQYRAGAGGPGGDPAQQPVIESRAARRRVGGSRAAHQPRARAQPRICRMRSP